MTDSSELKRVLIGFTGSVATIKDSELIAAVLGLGNTEVIAVYTKHASVFRTDLSKAQTPNTAAACTQTTAGEPLDAWSTQTDHQQVSSSAKQTDSHTPGWLSSKPVDKTLGVRVFTDEDEWNWTDRNSPVLHIELRKWADVGLIAPLSANTLAKLSQGICDNLLVGST